MILITGASGSGTTTLGQALAAKLHVRHLDGDDYYWLSTQTPYTERRAPNERLSLLLSDLLAEKSVVVSGSIMGWGEELENKFDLIVFLYLDASVRLERLRKRELDRFGKADPDFLEWAAQYDVGLNAGRSLAKHQAWLADRTCRIFQLIGDLSPGERLNAVLEYLAINFNKLQ